MGLCVKVVLIKILLDIGSMRLMIQKDIDLDQKKFRHLLLLKDDDASKCYDLNIPFCNISEEMET
jgi:hypothetical protein